jgi:kinesin family protein 20
MERSVIEILDDRRVRLSAPSESHAFKTKNRHDGIFLFNRVFNGDTSQENLFNEIGKPAVESVVVSGQNRTILCYGVTNAGKSFTIYGTPDNSGLVLRSIGSILSSIGQNHSDIPLKPFRFNEVELQKQDDYKPLQECLFPDDNEYEYALFFSAYENYGDKIFDLFDTTHESLDLKRAPTSKRAVYVDKLSKHRIRSLSDAQVLLDRVHKYRRVEATQHNSMSSRSHALFLLQLIKIPKFDLGVIEDYSQIIKYTSMSTLMFVDLAGSERCSTMTTTERRKEAGAINNSLSALQACIRDIRGKTSNSRGGEFVSFRNSKLTQILEYELTSSQKGALTFIININPSHKCYDETSHVMEFSVIARELKPQPLSKIDSGLPNNGLNRLVQKGSMKNFSSLKKPLSASIRKLTGKFREFSNENSPTTNNGKASNQNLLRNEMVDDYTRNIAEMEEFYNDMLKNMVIRSNRKLILVVRRGRRKKLQEIRTVNSKLRCTNFRISWRS